LQEDSLCIYKIVGIYKHILKQLAYIKQSIFKSSRAIKFHAGINNTASKQLLSNTARA